MLGILAIAGIILRLTRNLDKSRGFVNGALCIVIEHLDGNGYFIAKLLGSGDYVLVHPMERAASASYLAATGVPPPYDEHKALL